MKLIWERLQKSSLKSFADKESNEKTDLGYRIDPRSVFLALWGLNGSENKTTIVSHLANSLKNSGEQRSGWKNIKRHKCRLRAAPCLNLI